MPLSKQNLTILNASAGSGKTRNLVKEYIRLLIEDQSSGKSFSSILAMTFTNKAALEMKERIIKSLDEISHELGTMDMAAELAKELNITLNEIQSRCGVVLKGILHQYEEFHVMTIDKFNLRLIKSFSRDLDLPVDFEIVLDEEELIAEVVDDLMNQLGNENESTLNRLLFKYAEANLEEEKGWNFRSNLIQFGSILKKEKNFQIVNKLIESDLSVDRYKELDARLKSTDKAFKHYQGQVAAAYQLDVNDPKDLPGGKTIANRIIQIIEADHFLYEKELFSDHVEKNIREGTSQKQMPDFLRKKLLELQHFWNQEVESYRRIIQYRKNFFNLALLKFLAEALEEVKKDQQVLRISEFNQLISELIQHEDAPFIYERLGNRFKNYLLDEFQDTSHMQWLNMVPLIHDSLSNHNKNLIVGDPKQSIYRFKNGIAEQFIELPGIYNPANDPVLKRKSAYFRSMGAQEELLSNWRSSPVIVQFNNELFESMRTQMSDHARSFYTSINQQAKRTFDGKVSLLSHAGEIEESDLLQRIVDQIEECKAAGYREADICILGRVNRECNRWAIELNDLDYKVVSQDSLLISSDFTVQLCISYLKLRLRPYGEHEIKRFAELYFRTREAGFNKYRSYLGEKKNAAGKTYRFFDSEQFIVDHFGKREKLFFKYEHLYDLLTGFYHLLDLSEIENPYLHHLTDVIYEFSLHRGPDLKGFIDEYEQKKNSMAVQIPESDDAIKIMTIHKSKGLQFPVVIIPKLDFTLDVKGEQLIDSDDLVFYKTPAASDLIEDLKKAHDSEKEQILIDSINLSYVALTRPQERLYITNYHRDKQFGSRFHEALLNMERIDSKMNRVELEFGSDQTIDTSADTIGETLLNPIDIRDNLWFPDIALQDKEELTETNYLNEKQQFGRQFHYLMSKINNREDIDKQIRTAVDEGEISESNCSQLRVSLHKLFDNAEYVSLLSNSREYISEQSIIVDENTTLRPDKIVIKENETVVIDFKTGDIPKSSDKKQISEYRHNLEQIGYPNVQAYLVYTSTNSIEQVS